uniref:ULP_PROTEASE domain-containing protein n=1 Tax=Elaeophora elaphi TaxID=1147741 RepID=A0A0R3RY82_9BILA
MDFFQTVEDPRHTPGKRHGYAKEQSSPQAFSNTKQKSLISSFITTPPVAKPRNHFTGHNINGASKLYQAKQHKQEHSNYKSLYPSQKSAFLAYRSSPIQKPLEIQIEPPSIIDDLPNGGILRPEPRYATSISQGYNEKTTELETAQYSINNNVRLIPFEVCDTVLHVDKLPRKSPMIAEKKMEDLPRMKNFKNILNKFQLASDRALQQQQQRERIRYNTSDRKSNQTFNIPDWKQTIEIAYSERDCKLTKNKKLDKLQHENSRAFTISIPIGGRNTRTSLPKQWITQVNDTHADAEQPSPTMSDISSLPQTPPISSSNKSSNRTNSLRLISVKQRAFFDNRFHQNESATRQFRTAQNINRSRPISEIEAGRSATGTPSSHGCIIRCTSTESNRKFIPVAQMSSHSPTPSESRSVKRMSRETEDDNSVTSVVGLYKQAEPVGIHFSSMKSDLSVGNIWNPPILVEIKAKYDEEQRIFQSITRHRNSQKYRFLIIPRYNLFTFKLFADNHQQDVSEEYEQKVCFILLQLICALKSFQLNGIEAVSDDLSEFVLLCRSTRTNHKIGHMDHLPRILLLQESLTTTNKKSSIRLCDYGLKILSTMLDLNCNSPTNFASTIQECASALQQDKSSSLTEAKNALEFGMFVGNDAFSFNNEEDVQAWIDSKRADYFREMAGGSCSLNEVYEQLRLQFLLSVTPRTLLKMFENMQATKILNKTSFYV